MPSPLAALSPLDGRYARQLRELSPLFSEAGLIRQRLKIEIEYVIALSREKGIRELPPLARSQQKQLRRLYEEFSLRDAQRVKKIEQETDHDVKAVEYYIRQRLPKNSVKSLGEFIHFALTSEDVNNLAYSLMWQAGRQVYGVVLQKLLLELKQKARAYKTLPLLALTHGQAASPTTFGKELAVFYWRLKTILQAAPPLPLPGKFSGAVGNWNAQLAAYPNVNWLTFSRKFVEGLGLAFNPLTTQIESHDALAAEYQTLMRLNTVVVNLCQDMWLYISRGLITQKPTGSVGSSTMPHKVNPIKFENAESNANLANAIFHHLSTHLPVSRLQRDLRDSTLIRNQGVALGHSLLALKYLIVGLGHITPKEAAMRSELDEHWEVLAEPLQIMLRKAGHPNAYERVRNFTRGQAVTVATIRDFIRTLPISEPEKKRLLRLTPATYVGLAGQLVEKYVR